MTPSERSTCKQLEVSEIEVHVPAANERGPHCMFVHKRQFNRTGVVLKLIKQRAQEFFDDQIGRIKITIRRLIEIDMSEHRYMVYVVHPADLVFDKALFAQHLESPFKPYTDRRVEEPVDAAGAPQSVAHPSRAVEYATPDAGDEQGPETVTSLSAIHGPIMEIHGRDAAELLRFAPHQSERIQCVVAVAQRVKVVQLDRKGIPIILIPVGFDVSKIIKLETLPIELSQADVRILKLSIVGPPRFED